MTQHENNEVADDPSAAFFEGASRGVLMIKACRDCSTSLEPGADFCTECLSEEIDWLEASGQATLFTFAIMHQKAPGFEDRGPFPIAVVELAEGPRMYSNIVDCANDDLEVGMQLLVTFEGSDDGKPVPRFRPA